MMNTDIPTDLFVHGNDADVQTSLCNITVVSRTQKAVPSTSKKVAHKQPKSDETVRVGNIDKVAFHGFKTTLMLQFSKYHILDLDALDNFFYGGGYDNIHRNTRIDIALIMFKFLPNNEYCSLLSTAEKHFTILREAKHIHSINSQLKKTLSQGIPTSQSDGELMLWYYIGEWARRKATEIG